MAYLLSGVVDKTYTGYRTTDEPTDAHVDEVYTPSLEGWTLAMPSKTCLDKRNELSVLFGTLLPLETRALYSDIATRVYTALGTNDLALAVYWVQEAGKQPTANQQHIQAMLAVLEDA